MVRYSYDGAGADKLRDHKLGFGLGYSPVECIRQVHLVLPSQCERSAGQSQVWGTLQADLYANMI